MLATSRPALTPRADIAMSKDQRYCHMVAAGCWTVDDVDTSHAKLEEMMAAMRRDGRPGRALFDLRQASVQPASVVERVQYWNGRIFRSGDRVAMIVVSNLLNRQSRRVETLATLEAFLDENAACGWLMADA